MAVRTLTSVLVANRGEIAVRVVRACADAALGSVAVYADPDRDAVHARLADTAIALPGSALADTYLSVPALLDAAHRGGADAVHPGYGFLSESAAFARAVLDAGLTWIGPPPEAIDLLGDKVRARALAASVGAPLAPGLPAPVTDVQEVLAFGRTHGYPVVLKATSGGGGRGQRVAHSADGVPAAFAAATAEAEAVFGDGACFVERYLAAARHVETQCLADATGTVHVLSTRDCTLQRRNQKLVEEAPAPFLPDGVQHRLETASRDLLRAAGYTGAGTCEFLLDEDGTLAFLEVNTRLQVEHPVTEAVTGVDLVLEQFRIAAGGTLDTAPPAVRGHAVEIRVNAEDPRRGFAPSPGTLTRFRPAGGPGVRVDAGVAEGDRVPGRYDPLLAKLVVWGADRAQALARARRAVAETEITGVATTLPLAAAALDSPAFAGPDGLRITTGWVEDELLPGWTASEDGAPPSPAPVAGGRLPRVYRDDAAPLDAPRDETAYRSVVVEVDRRRVELALPEALFGAPERPDGPAPRPGGRRSRAARPGLAPSGSAPGVAVPFPLPGTVVAVHVAEGQAVAAGEQLAVLEAMKLQQPVTAPVAGTVTGVAVTAGQEVDGGEELCRVLPAEGG